jgi:1-acyl-sn-glycerol-3-phosphate acyltransferase
MTPGKCRTVFLDEISVKGYTMQDIGLLKDKVYAVMDAGLRRYRKYPDA